MDVLDNLLLQKVGSYLDDENCCMKSSLHNWGVANKNMHGFIKKHFKLKLHKQMRFREDSSALKWKVHHVCTKCFHLSSEEIRELVHLKGCSYHHDDDEIGLFRSVFGNRKSNTEENKKKIKSGSMYIHFKTQKEVQMFISKLPILLHNVQCSQEYCCDGKGARVVMYY